MSNYKLVNPFIEGDLKNSFAGKTQLEAASKAWNALSANFSGSTPKFAFTLQRVKDGQLFHFTVSEKTHKDKVDFSIQEHGLEESEKLKKFKNRLTEVTEMSGGRRKYLMRDEDEDEDDEDEDEDSESDVDRELKSYLRRMKRRNQHMPILYWWYYPAVYQPIFEQINLHSFFVPQFLPPMTPIIEVEVEVPIPL